MQPRTPDSQQPTAPTMMSVIIARLRYGCEKAPNVVGHGQHLRGIQPRGPRRHRRAVYTVPQGAKTSVETGALLAEVGGGHGQFSRCRPPAVALRSMTLHAVGGIHACSGLEQIVGKRRNLAVRH